MLELADSSLLRQQAYIDGQWLDAESKGTFAVDNPATGATLIEVPEMGQAETRRAIDAAERALPAWRGLAAGERSKILRRWFDLIIEHTEDLARIMTAEQGKPLAEARSEVTYGASFVEWFAEEARRLYGETIPATRANQRILVIHQPVGVCGAITPWNFPIAMITRKAAPALAAGCTMVVKPAEATPLSALALAALAERAGIPPGVLNIVTGLPAEIGGELTSSTKVQLLSFTGSTKVGKLLIRQCADTVKKLAMELGGNAPFIVFDDADLDAAIEGLMESKFRNTGQTCVCTNRILVQRGIYREFAEKFQAAMAEQLRMGPGTDPNMTQGPLINEAAVNKVHKLVTDALEKGAQLGTGGQPHPLGGAFYEPTLLLDCSPQMAIANEEAFGPVAPLFPFDTEEEAITLANASNTGLAGYFYSRSLARAFRVAEAIEVGMVGVNTGLISTSVAPFGGVKESGIGREGGHQGMLEYTEEKYICVAGL